MPVHIVNDTPFAIGFTAGRVRKRGLHLTTVLKGAFKLVHGSPATPDERPLLSGDLHVDDDALRSCRYASDFAPFKPRADVLATGTCHVEGGRPRPSARASIRVGNVRKVLSITGDRHFIEHALGGLTISEPAPFRSMPLGWERAFGGPGFGANPVGMGFAPPGGPGSRKLPNVELAGAAIRFPTDEPTPGGFGPVDRRWSPRASKLGTYDDAWLAERWPDFPDDLDWTYFNAAPADQQTPWLRGDEPIVVEGMHPEHARFESSLPGLRPRCFISRPSRGHAPVEEVALQLDTVTIDMDAGTLVLVWRGLSPVASRDFAEIDRCLVVVEHLADPPRDASHYADPAVWQSAVSTQAELAEQDEAAARAAAPEPPPPPPVADDGDASEKESLDLARADLDKAGADPALLERLKGVTKASVFTAILVEDIERQTAAEKAADEGADADASAPPDEATELDRMREELAKSGAEPALLARAATATTTGRLLEILLETVPTGESPSARKERADLVEAIRRMDADAEAAKVSAVGRRRAARGDRLTRAEVVALVAHGGSLAESNLTELDLSGLALRGVDLSAAKLDGANLERADLALADLTGASLRLARLSGALAPTAVWQGANLEGADLRHADLSGAQLSNARLVDAQLDGAKLDGADLTSALLGAAIMNGASLSGASLESADLRGASLRDVRAAKATFRKAHLDGADLGEAHLDGAVLIGCTMDGARLSGASLRDAHLDGAAGVEASFVGSDLTGARAGGARFPRGRFEKVVGSGSGWAGAELGGADFRGARLDKALFTGADLRGANFELARLEEADLSKSALVGARLVHTNLFRARLGGADLTGADCRASNMFESDLFEAVTEGTRFERTNLKRTCKDLGGVT